MKQITYAGATFVTSDQVSEALLELVAKLGSTESTLKVEVPAYDRETSSTVPIGIVIGPSSEIMSTPLAWSRDEPDDAASVEVLHGHVDSLQLAHPVPTEPGAFHDPDFFIDDL